MKGGWGEGSGGGVCEGGKGVEEEEGEKERICVFVCDKSACRNVVG